MIKLPGYVEKIIDVLENNGHEAYVVGGSLRDIYLGSEPHDWDVCTSAMPEETIACFNGYRIIETGLKHGTVTVMSDGNPIEITTYRIDGAYNDCRHPDSVSFTKDVHEDLLRRDFTVNAMAYSHKRGFVDCCGSRDDIDQGIIRCVGNPEERFCEDALRIMRCLRFSAVLGFSIDEATKNAAKLYEKNLESISKERIWTELWKMLCAEDSQKLADVIREFTSVFEVIMPQIKPAVGFWQNNKHHFLDVWDHTLYAISKSVSNPMVRLVLLLHDLGKPVKYTVDEFGEGHFKGHPMASEDIAKEILSMLKVDNKTKDTVSLLVRHHDDKIEPTESCVKRWLSGIGEDNFFLLLDVKRADIVAHVSWYVGPEIEKCDLVEKIAEKVIAEEQCFKLKDMKINGNDIKNLGVKDGKKIGFVLNRLLEDIIAGKVQNEHDELIMAASIIIDVDS